VVELLELHVVEQRVHLVVAELAFLLHVLLEQHKVHPQLQHRPLHEVHQHVRNELGVRSLQGFEDVLRLVHVVFVLKLLKRFALCISQLCPTDVYPAESPTEDSELRVGFFEHLHELTHRHVQQVVGVE